jgi:hypothetical protein
MRRMVGSRLWLVTLIGTRQASCRGTNALNIAPVPTFRAKAKAKSSCSLFQNRDHVNIRLAFWDERDSVRLEHVR